MKEIYKSKKNKILATGSTLLAALALTACGEDGGKKDIFACPDGYTQGATALESVPAAQQALQGGVAELRTLMPTSGSYAKTDAIDKDLVGAAVAVFNKNNAFLLDVSQETRVDDVSEAFCSQGKNIYLSPQGDAAVGALASAGIEIEFPQK